MSIPATTWANKDPKHVIIPVHGSSVVTFLKFSRGRIISASDNHNISIHSTDGKLLHSLDGHDGGIWSVDVCQDTLVSGSTDRTIRIWDLSSGKCQHIFSGHTSTVRALSIVKPELVDFERDGIITKERWPKRPLIVTGSRDHSLRVWTLPRPGEGEFKSDLTVDVDDTYKNPYHRRHILGHDGPIRSLATRGRIAVTGSYDCTVRVWDIITGDCKWVLIGHTSKVYSVVLDLDRNQIYSGSMDCNVRIWDIQTGECRHILTEHASLVGLLGISPSHLVSAAADSTLCIWDPISGELRHKLVGHTGTITCFQHDERKVISGSDGMLRLWDVRDGTALKDILTDIVGVWQIFFTSRFCVAATHRRDDQTSLEVWDFGDEDGHVDELDEENLFIYCEQVN